MTTRYATFEQFPRRPLSFRLTRRQLLANFAIEMAVAQGEAEGGQGHRLSLLGLTPDAELMNIVPQIVSDCVISFTNGKIWATVQNAAHPVPLFDHDEALLAAFNHFNGRATLHDASCAVQRITGWEPDRCFALTRGLFLHLVQLYVCKPTWES